MCWLATSVSHILILTSTVCTILMCWLAASISHIYSSSHPTYAWYLCSLESFTPRLFVSHLNDPWCFCYNRDFHIIWFRANAYLSLNPDCKHQIGEKKYHLCQFNRTNGSYTQKTLEQIDNEVLYLCARAPELYIHLLFAPLPPSFLTPPSLPSSF